MRATILLALCGAVFVSGMAQAAEVNLYSARNEALIKPLLERFTAHTGIEVNLITGKADALLQRLVREGPNSPADVLLTTDAGRLHRAKEAGVLQPLESALLEAAIPAQYRDNDNYWYGLSVRARVILYAKDRVDPAQLSGYADLAAPAWKGKVCIRSSDNIYNQSLTAAQIAHHGEAATQAWAEGLVSNLARKPAGGDRDQIKAAAVGQCDLAVVNTYYLGGMLRDKDEGQRALAEKLGVFWPDQQGHGTHVNVSGAGITTSAKHVDAARQLVEFLASDEAQAWYAETNHEYPVKPGIGIGELQTSWGPFKADDLPLHRLGELNASAVKLMDRAGWQ